MNRSALQNIIMKDPVRNLHTYVCAFSYCKPSIISKEMVIRPEEICLKFVNQAYRLLKCV